MSRAIQISIRPKIVLAMVRFVTYDSKFLNLLDLGLLARERSP